jgi:hypothetical protein
MDQHNFSFPPGIRQSWAAAQIAAPLFAEVDSPRVTPMRLADRLCEAVLGLWDRDQMDVVGHQAIAPNLDPFLPAPLGHESSRVRACTHRLGRDVSSSSILTKIMSGAARACREHVESSPMSIHAHDKREHGT